MSNEHTTDQDQETLDNLLQAGQFAGNMLLTGMMLRLCRRLASAPAPTPVAPMPYHDFAPEIANLSQEMSVIAQQCKQFQTETTDSLQVLATALKRPAEAPVPDAGHAAALASVQSTLSAIQIALAKQEQSVAALQAASQTPPNKQLQLLTKSIGDMNVRLNEITATLARLTS